MSIRAKFALIMALPLVLVYVALNVMQFMELGRTTLNEERGHASTMVQMQSEEVSAYARLVHLRASGVLATVEAVDAILPHRLKVFLGAAGDPPWVAGIALIDARGKPPHEEVLTAPTPQVDLKPCLEDDAVGRRMRRTMEEALKTGLSGWKSAEPNATRATPIFVRVNAARTIAVAIALDAAVLTEHVVTTDDRADPWLAVDSNGTVILGNPPSVIGKHVSQVNPVLPADETARIREQMIAKKNGSLEIEDPRYWLGWSAVNSTPWRVLLPIDMRAIMEPVWAAVWRDAIIAMVGLGVNLAIVALLAGFFTRPIRRLSEAFKEVRAGAFDVRVPVKSKDEMGQLGSGFNAMTVQLGDLVRSHAKAEAAKAVLEREKSIASEMQESLLPSPDALPDSPTGRVQALMRPALAVGGDFYDAWMKGDSIWFTVADVSGKGVAAGLFMAVATTILRGVRRHVDDPAEALTWLNDRLLEGEEERPVFLTMFLGRLDPDGTIAYASAGHLPAIRFGNGQKAHPLADATGPPLAMARNVEWTTGTLQLKAGQHLLIYSDGAVEARRSDGSMVDIDGLVQLVEEIGERSDEERVERLIESLQAIETHGQSDDITVMSVTRTARHDGATI